MTILVVGENGQLAQSLVAAAKTLGLPLATTGRPRLDLSDKDGVSGALEEALAAVQPSIVINAAAYTAVDRAEAEPELAFAINAQAVEDIGRVCNQHAIPTLHISTDYVFDGQKREPYSEADVATPLGAYGRSKFAGEEALRQSNPRHVIVRTAWLHSPFGSNFLKTMLRLATERTELSVVDDQRGNPTYAPHLAAALLQIAHRVAQQPDDEMWGTYHAVGTGEATWFEFAREIFAQSGRRGLPVPTLRPITTAQYPTVATRPANSRLDCTLLRERFGIALPPWQQGVEECVNQLTRRAEKQ